MKIVLIDREEWQKIGGIGVFTTRFYHYLKDLGHEVYILRFAKKRSKDNNILHVPFYYAEPRGFVFLPSEKTLQIIRKYLTKIKPDIIYCAIGISPFDFFLPQLCHELKIPITAVWHADFNQSLSSYQILVKSIFLAYLQFCKQLDLLHVFSDKLAQFYINHGIKKERILVLPNGIDTKLYTPGDSAFGKRFGIKKGVLFLGRLTFQKNPRVLIKSFLSLNPPRDTKLVIVGGGDQEEELRGDFKDRRIIFTGAILDERRKLDIMRACQIFVLPSRFEGMPLALLEAMACGLACVTSDAGGNKELLSGVGITIPTARLNQELPAVLRILLEHSDIRDSLSKKAYLKVRKDFSQEIIFNRLICALHDTAAAFPKIGPPPTPVLDFDKFITHKLRSIWKKTKQLTSYLEI
jgi:glycosyltransferase involved in cell wall biosynthesis